MRNAYEILVGKSEWKRPRGRCRRGREDNIERILKTQIVKVWTGVICLRIENICGPLWTR